MLVLIASRPQPYKSTPLISHFNSRSHPIPQNTSHPFPYSLCFELQMASFTAPCPKACSAPFVLHGSQRSHPQQQQHLLSFHNCLNRSSLLQASKLQRNINKQSGAWKVQALSKVTTEKPSNFAPINNTKFEDESVEKVSDNIPDASSISAFMAQVSDLVKLVDSRDIVELQMKQLDLEPIVRKKEALEKLAPQAPVAAVPPPYPMQFGRSPTAPAAAPAPASPASAALAASAPALPAPAPNEQQTTSTSSTSTSSTSTTTSTTTSTSTTTTTTTNDHNNKNNNNNNNNHIHISKVPSTVEPTSK